MPFNDVQGQNHVVFALSHAIYQQRLHHAYLFFGPSGVGKERMAIRLVQALLCQTPYPMSTELNQPLGACGSCHACQTVAQQLHPDFHVIQREVGSKGSLATEIKIQQIRDLQQALSLKAFNGGRRVILIHEADRMGQATANALLKALEEPGENTFFILLTDRFKAVLPTIASRCQKLRFMPLSLELTLSLLKENLAQLTELPTYSPQDLEQLCRLSEGSIGLALDYAKNGILEKLQRWLPLIEKDQNLADIDQKWKLSEELVKDTGQDLALWFKLMKLWYRDLLLCLELKDHSVEALDHFLILHRFKERVYLKAQGCQAKHLRWRIQALEEVELQFIQRVSANKKLMMDQLMLYLSGGDLRFNQGIVL
jgi:DNA polymerase-3 subunit delta'